uniref:NADH-ubiquinone oxidoreductase chain 2 n=1 Tax=Lachesilla sp. LaspGHN TaxID=2597012 RepID=A0A8K1ZFY8_9NEOP|nr:NADH dehydrogenase subunit 2 [Lachesilla sp. LaspGHN]
MLNNLNILFMILIFSSSILSVSSSSWLGVWMGLELNMLSFIPLLIEQKNSLSNEVGLKYFLVQAMASSLFISFSIMNTFWFIPFSIFNPMNFNLLILPLLIKLGAAPFQTWFIMLMNKLNWWKALLLATWQKFTPLVILSYIFMNQIIIIMISSFSLLVGSVGGLTQTSFQKIFAFSSISHLGWIISSLLVSSQLMFLYFVLYTLMNTMLFLFMFLFNTFHFNQNLLNLQSTIFTLSILSLSGLPPFWGFISKWLVIQNLISLNQMLLTFLLIFSALINLIFYLRLITNYSMLSFSSMKWLTDKNKISKTSLMIFFALNLMGLLMFNFILL